MLTDWDKEYMKITDLTPEPEPAHWAWTLLGVVLALVCLALAGAYIAERLA